MLTCHPRGGYYPERPIPFRSTFHFALPNLFSVPSSQAQEAQTPQQSVSRMRKRSAAEQTPNRVWRSKRNIHVSQSPIEKNPTISATTSTNIEKSDGTNVDHSIAAVSNNPQLYPSDGGRGRALSNRSQFYPHSVHEENGRLLQGYGALANIELENIANAMPPKLQLSSTTQLRSSHPRSFKYGVSSTKKTTLQRD
jgi:hypothetical protein